MPPCTEFLFLAQGDNYSPFVRVSGELQSESSTPPCDKALAAPPTTGRMVLCWPRAENSRVSPSVAGEPAGFCGQNGGVAGIRGRPSPGSGQVHWCRQVGRVRRAKRIFALWGLPGRRGRHGRHGHGRTPKKRQRGHFFSRAWGGATEFTKSKACANQLTSFSARPWPGVWSADHTEQRTRTPSWGTHPTNFTSPYLHCTRQ